jgi:hypothetical protein
MELQLKAYLLKFNTRSIITTVTTIILMSSPLFITAKPVYECKNSGGVTIYTDNPKSNPDCVNAVEKKVAPLPSFKTPNQADSVVAEFNPDTEITADSTTDSVTENQKYSKVIITEPGNGVGINRPGGEFNVNFNVTPNLFSGDMAQLLVDGAPYGEPTSGNSFTTHLDPGDHTLVVQIKRDGKTIQSSNTVSFTFTRNKVRH